MNNMATRSHRPVAAASHAESSRPFVGTPRAAAGRATTPAMLSAGGAAAAARYTRRDEQDDERWQSVVEHDRRADGQFVYGVRSTGVYCRPSCASRRPRRDRVAFFDTPAAARDAGFRACLRCKPDASAAAPDPWVEKFRRACLYLSHVEGHPALAALAARLGGSPYHLQRNFKRLVGVTPREYAEACRLGKVKRSLREAGDITGAIFEAGYASS